MRRHVLLSGLVIAALWGAALAAEKQQASAEKSPPQPASQKPPAWSMNATIIEACSCPMFCQCYFDTKPAAGDPHGHGGHAGHAAPANASKAADAGKAANAEAHTHFCKFNNAYRVNQGHHGDTKLDGVKFWVAGDLGAEFDDGEMDWAVLHFDPSVTKPQREGIQAALTHIYPVKWKSFTVGADKPIEWTATRDKAEARLDGGKSAEVVLKKNKGINDEPIVIRNLKYWGTPRNDGFMLMQNDVQSLRQVPEGQQPFEFKRTNGFMITFDINANDVAAAAAPKDAKSK
jgi:hypothetical protein